MLSRRKLLTTAVVAAGTFAAEKSLGQAANKRVVVDSQVHIWKDVVGPPREPFTYEPLLAMMDEAGVERVVIVPPTYVGGRNDYALEAAQKYPKRFGVMGLVTLQDPSQAARLPTWTKQQGMVGVRLSFTRNAGKLLKDGTADWFWPEADKAGLNVMFLAPGQTAHFGSLAERYPRIHFIADHMGLHTDAVKEGKTEEEVAHTLTLAKYPNVSVKLSGLANLSLQAYPYADMTPYIKRVFDAFGPQRSFWGSDMTIALKKATYTERVRHLQELPFLSESDKDWVMGKAILQRLKWA